MHAVYSVWFRDITLYNEANEQVGQATAYNMAEAREAAEGWNLETFDDDMGHTYPTQEPV